MRISTQFAERLDYDREHVVLRLLAARASRSMTASARLPAPRGWAEQVVGRFGAGTIGLALDLAAAEELERLERNARTGRVISLPTRSRRRSRNAGFTQAQRIRLRSLAIRAELAAKAATRL